MGFTYVLSTFRRSETTHIADIESATESGCVHLRAYGPYRSPYGRLGEFPNLPPLLVSYGNRIAGVVCDHVLALQCFPKKRAVTFEQLARPADWRDTALTMNRCWAWM